MKRVVAIVALVGALATVGASAALAGGGPITKQNGTTPVFADFTSICSVAGYAWYGDCNGEIGKFTDITGRINAIQAKAGVWNLGFSFTKLEPGASYTLWGNRTDLCCAPLNGFFAIGTVVAALDGTARFSYQTTVPSGLGFDLNRYYNTVVTSYWSSQTIKVLNPDGTLYVPST
jgi:hypothetical protein